MGGGQEGTMSMDTPAPLDVSLTKAENQRTNALGYRANKCPQISGFKVSRHAETIKKIREHELPCLEAMVEIPFT